MHKKGVGANLRIPQRSRGIPSGANRDRTGDLLNAIQALSQLSYSPVFLRVVLGERPEWGQAHSASARVMPAPRSPNRGSCLTGVDDSPNDYPAALPVLTKR
jgi:hypothetical protein